MKTLKYKNSEGKYEDLYKVYKNEENKEPDLYLIKISSEYGLEVIELKKNEFVKLFYQLLPLKLNFNASEYYTYNSEYDRTHETIVLEAVLPFNVNTDLYTFDDAVGILTGNYINSRLVNNSAMLLLPNNTRNTIYVPEETYRNNSRVYPNEVGDLEAISSDIYEKICKVANNLNINNSANKKKSIDILFEKA